MKLRKWLVFRSGRLGFELPAAAGLALGFKSLGGGAG